MEPTSAVIDRDAVKNGGSNTSSVQLSRPPAYYERCAGILTAPIGSIPQLRGYHTGGWNGKQDGLPSAIIPSGQPGMSG